MKRLMEKGQSTLLILFVLILGVSFATLTHITEDVYGADVELGKKVYTANCVICHGPKGDGKGLINLVHRVQKRGIVIKIYPRDFTAGTFKFRTTPTGCPPTDDDLLRVVTNGIPRSGMPSHANVPLEKRKAVVAYIKKFSEKLGKWEEQKEESCKPVSVKKPALVGTAASIEKGKKLYQEMKCWECHGQKGKGDGPKSKTLKDDWKDQILPFDFTSGATKRGNAPEDIYLAYTTGLDGSGMPSFADSLKEDERWHLVSYTLKLMGRTK